MKIVFRTQPWQTKPALFENGSLSFVFQSINSKTVPVKSTEGRAMSDEF
jgi:hypothetical protein